MSSGSATSDDQAGGDGFVPLHPSASRRLLLIGYGNPARADDGLGPALAARVEALGIPHVDVEVDYQLSIEHAELLSRCDIVIFADADIALDRPCALRRVQPDFHAMDFSSHALTPEVLLGLASALFGAAPAAWALGIRALDISSFAEGLTAEASRHLDHAFARLARCL